ncbi:circadian clock-controlled protein daywake [Solenopsis invicta]|uniref:circadian clock-controlled protein daywake n=1 Tax=Solenopsis invicta TaxID=13686 RepID=UPI000595FD96|nr:circadian clock-controlled protein daywake [Solenopsis invicta]
MSFCTLALFCATAFVLAAAQEIELPVTTCKHDADDYASCLKAAVIEAWPKFVPGIPDIGVPVLDPYFTEEERILYEAEDIKLDVTVKNVNTYGLAKIEFLAVRPYYSDNFFKLEFDFALPKALMEGNFKADGTVKAFHMGGEGTFNISMEDVKGSWIVEGGVANDRWTIEHFYLNPEIGKMNVWFSDMFNGNNELTDAALKFVNEYWPTLYRQMLPMLAKNWDEHVTEVLNSIFSKVSFSKTFP